MEHNGHPLVQKTSEIIADGSTVNENPAAAFRGLGCVTSNGSSRLLMDYKANFPEVYEEIIRQLFAPDYGAGLTHIKVEFGADISASSGTEPCVKRFAEETPDVTRGAGFMLAADAKRINSNVTTDLFRYGEPHWVTAAFEESKETGYAARYRWFYETLVAAYITYGLTFDYISPDVNGTEKADTEWLIYFAKHLREQENPPYDFSSVKLAASSEVGSCMIAEEMLKNEELRNAVDVITLHDTACVDDNTQLLHDVYGKEIWYSEGIVPCNVPELSCRVGDSGMISENNTIDAANHIINSYVHGRMVMYEFQPAVSAYYDDACCSNKQLITANAPWSGHYKRNISFWIAAHFTRFAKNGWQYVDSACFGDGEDDHATRNNSHNYITLVSPDRRHLTMHISNESDMPRSYLVIVSHLPDLPHTLHLVETVGNGNCEQIGRSLFRVVDDMHVHPVKGDMAFPVVVKPHSLLTVTTMDVSDLKKKEQVYPAIPEPQRLPLPFHDNFTYEDAFLNARGSAPLYTADRGGTFEVVKTGDSTVLQQMITKENLPKDLRFRRTSDPLTCFGDDTWANYQCSTKFRFAADELDNYAALGMRCNSAVTCSENAVCGLMLQLFTDGKWELHCMEELLEVGKIADFQYDSVHHLQLIAIGTLILAFVDGHSVAELKNDSSPMVRSGRMCLQSAHYRNQFLEVSASEIPMPMPAYCWRLDCLSPQIRYSDGWKLDGMADCRFFNHTCAKGIAGEKMEIRFHGSGIILLGKTEHTVVSLLLDGRMYAEAVVITNSNFRESFYSIEGLSDGWHTLKLEIEEGTLEFDAAEIPTNALNPVYLPPKSQSKPVILSPAEQRPSHPASKLAKAALPLAGIAATGLAVAFTVGAIVKKKKKSK